MTELPPVEPSFDAIYRRFAPAVMGYLRANGVDDEEAAMQEVFISVLPRISKISGGEDGARMLLFSIAHARVVDHHRHRARFPASAEYVAERDTRTTHSAEDIALSRDRDSSAMAIVASLREDYRQVILLRVVADLPLEQVAKVLGRSVGSIKQLQRRALLSLSQHPNITDGSFQ